jgi:hypothetical protein
MAASGEQFNLSDDIFKTDSGETHPPQKSSGQAPAKEKNDPLPQKAILA